MIYHSKSLVLARKGRAFYEALYQGCFFEIQGGGTSLIRAVCIKGTTVYFKDPPPPVLPKTALGTKQRKTHGLF